MTIVQILRQLVPAAAGFALNLSLIGAMITFPLTVALALSRGAMPRMRYVIALGAFLIAVAVPFMLTFRKSEGASLHFDVRSADRTSLARPLPLQSTIDGAVSWSDRVPLSAWLVGGWLAISLSLVFREVVGHVALVVRRRGWSLAPRTVKDSLRWPEDIPLYLSDSAGPGTVGLLRPGVVLPRALLSDLDEGIAWHVARHEVAHVRWRDPLVNALVRLLRALLWPSIPLWVLERIIRLEREASADAEAIDDPEADRLSLLAAYARALVVAASRRERLPHAAGLGSHFGLDARVRRLFVERPGAGRITGAALLLIAGLAATAVLPVAEPARPPLPNFRHGETEAYRATAAAVTAIMSSTRYRNHNLTPDVRRCLADIRARGSLEPVSEALAAPDRRTREAAAWIAGQLGDAGVTPALIALLHDGDPHVQRTSAWALGMIGDHRAAGDLSKLLADHNADARAGAAWALGRMGAHEQIEPLIRMLHDRDADAQHAAAWALGRLGDPRAIGPLEETAHSAWSPDVRDQALRSLHGIQQ